MNRVLGRHLDTIYPLVRVVAGLLFLCHGGQKLFGLFGGIDGAGGHAGLLSLMGAAGIIEFFGGSLIALGVSTSAIAFIASGEMATAFFIAHLPRGGWPIENQGELAVLYCFLFLFIAARGSGRYSLAPAFPPGRRH